MKLLNSPFSLLPSQFLRMRSLIRYGIDSAGLADTIWRAVLMQPNMSHSAADCLIHFCSQLLYHHFLSQLLLKRCEVCWSDHVCSLFCCSCRYCCWLMRCCVWPRSSSSVSTLADAPLPCQMQLNFVARLEPTRTCLEDGQVHMTSLETREASVQECNGVKAVCNSTQTHTKHRHREQNRQTDANRKRNGRTDSGKNL